MQYERMMPDWDYEAHAFSNKPFVESIWNVLTRRVCKSKGHPLTVNNSTAGPEGATEDVSCLCGFNSFHHVYF